MINFTTVKRNFSAEIDQPDEKISLAKASLYFAQAEYSDLDVEDYLDIFNCMAADIKKQLANISYPLKIIQTINHYLFEKLKFGGNTKNYYDPCNSYLNEVIDRRTGIPISLSVIYLEIAKRINFPMVGIAMPGHFLIRPDFEDAGIFVDAFHQGEILFEQDCEKRLQQVYQQPVQLEPHFFTAVSNQQILTRMLSNLKFIYANRQQYRKALEVIELLLLLLPNHPIEIRDQGLLYYQLNDWQKATADLKLYLALLPDANDAGAIRELLQKIQ